MALFHRLVYGPFEADNQWMDRFRPLCDPFSGTVLSPPRGPLSFDSIRLFDRLSRVVWLGVLFAIGRAAWDLVNQRKENVEENFPGIVYMLMRNV